MIKLGSTNSEKPGVESCKKWAEWHQQDSGREASDLPSPQRPMFNNNTRTNSFCEKSRNQLRASYILGKDETITSKPAGKSTAFPHLSPSPHLSWSNQWKLPLPASPRGEKEKIETHVQGSEAWWRGGGRLPKGLHSFLPESKLWQEKFRVVCYWEQRNKGDDVN